MTFRSFLGLAGLSFVFIFVLYMFGYIRPNKENVPFMVEKQPKIEHKTNTTTTNTNSTTPGK